MHLKPETVTSTFSALQLVSFEQLNLKLEQPLASLMLRLERVKHIIAIFSESAMGELNELRSDCGDLKRSPGSS